MFVVIAYDIQDDRRREALAKLLLEYGTRMQKSVFECLLEKRELDRLVEKVRPFVETSLESVRFYVLCHRCMEQSAHVGGLPLNRDPLFYLV
jgi:CRISPR-associated protein Cas2